MCYFYLLFFSGMTVEEGSRALLECPGFVPDPENPDEEDVEFIWFKAQLSDASWSVNKVAYLQRSVGTSSTTYNDLGGRASIDHDSGALEIYSTRVSDDHVYACQFFYTAKGDIENETTLVITGK